MIFKEMVLGAFIIPYFCIYFLIGTPLFFLEMSLGQFTSSGSAAAFKMSRMFKGRMRQQRIHDLQYWRVNYKRTWLGNGDQFILGFHIL